MYDPVCCLGHKDSKKLFNSFKDHYFVIIDDECCAYDTVYNPKEAYKIIQDAFNNDGLEFTCEVYIN